MERLKLIILYNKIFHYRIPIWNELAKHCDLTVTYSEGNGDIPTNMDVNFKIMFLPARVIKGLVIHKDNIRRLCKNYDAVIAYGNIAWLKFSTLPWFNKTPVVFHTIGVSASYGKGFDQHKQWDRLRAFFYSRANALAFYTDYPIEKYKEFGISIDKMFVAPNTVAVSTINVNKEKNSILFIGTLYREKGIQSLLNAYKQLRTVCSLPVLNIVGSGPDYDMINQWIEDNDMQNLVFLRGAVFDIEEKAKFFSKAIACISPRQAGLTVLESMGYGVPFISTKNAITGGELFNIHNGVDGILIDSEDELASVIKDIALYPNKYECMGKKAKLFYDQNRTPEHMAQGLWNSVQYAIKNRDIK